jgi:release factor glutamine methyltransferase
MSDNRKSGKIHLIIYKLYLLFIGKVRSSNILHLFLFNYRPRIENELHVGYWDWTTLILKKALRKHLKSTDSFLDMGTGYVGVLAIFANICLNCKKILAIDQLSKIISSAKKNSDRLKLNIEFCCSDLFSQVNGRFDMIAFNAPYLDIEKGRRSGIMKDELSELRFSGGVGGGETISRFLKEASKHLSDKGKILLGVNHYHIKQSTVQDLISCSGFELCECIESFYLPATAYLLRQK